MTTPPPQGPRTPPRPSVFVPVGHLAHGPGPGGGGEATHDVHTEDLDAVAGAATALSRWLLAPPAAPVLARLSSPATLAAWPLPDRERTAVGLAELVASRAGDNAAQIARDHARLFTGPGKLLAAPYESVHRSAEGLLFDEHTLRVREWYHHYGIRAPRERREPDDHIGLELEFLAALLGWSLEAHEAGAGGDAAAYAEAAGAFLEEHLHRWAPTLFDLVAERAETSFYRGVAHLGHGVLDEARRIWPS